MIISLTPAVPPLRTVRPAASRCWPKLDRRKAALNKPDLLGELALQAQPASCIDMKMS